MTKTNDFNEDRSEEFDLSAFDDDYASTKVPDFDEVPDGRYEVQIRTVKMAKSQSDEPMIKWDMVIITGPHTRRHIFKNSVITQSSLVYIKSDLKTLGLELEKLSGLPNHLDAMLDLVVEVTKRTKGKHANIYFNKRLNVPGAGDDDLPSQIPAPF